MSGLLGFTGFVRKFPCTPCICGRLAELQPRPDARVFSIANYLGTVFFLCKLMVIAGRPGGLLESQIIYLVYKVLFNALVLLYPVVVTRMLLLVVTSNIVFLE